MVRLACSVSGLLVAPWVALHLVGCANAAISPNCTTPTKFFAQLVEHGNPGEGTFQQQYQILSDHFKPGGPVLYYQQAETATFACLEHTIFPEWAAELGGMAISLEHRFFGLSNASNASNPIEQYKSMSLENVIADAVAFVNHVKASVPGAGDSKAIVIGGSYGGFLTTVLKMNQPEVFYGAIPYAAPLRSIGANYQNPKRFDWFTWVGQIYWDLSATAGMKMKQAFEAFHTRLDTTNDTTSIARELNLCSVPKTRADLSVLEALVATSAFLIPLTSYSNPIANPLGATPEKLVNETLEAKDAMQIINATLTMRMPPSQVPCISWDTDQSAESTLAKAPFNYLLCRYFPLSSNEIANGTIFTPTSIQTETDPATCKTLYNLVPPTQEEVETQYHLTRAELLGAKRILFAYDEYDPTTAVGIEPFPPSPDRNSSRYMFTSTAAHGEESIASFSGDKQAVIHARRVQLETIKEWLGLF